MIPLVDLGWQHAVIADDVSAGWERVVEERCFVHGPPVSAFEQAFAAQCGAPACVGVASGTDAIELALRALGVRWGDRCVLPANTFVATAEAVVRAGGVPLLVDCDDHGLIDVAQALDALPRARAVLPVHLYGQMAAIEALAGPAADTGCSLVEDAAQSHGARRHSRPMGALGGVATTSFFPGKNLGAYGDGGAVVCQDASVADRVRLLANHGCREPYRHEEIGVCSRLDTLQAVVLLAKLRHLDHWNRLRRAAADRYMALLAGDERVELPTTAPGNEHVWHLFVIRVDDRDRVLADLRAAGIGAGAHYPVPLHRQPAWSGLAPSRGFPCAERWASRLLSLPIFPGITQDQQVAVVEALRAALGRS